MSQYIKASNGLIVLVVVVVFLGLIANSGFSRMEMPSLNFGEDKIKSEIDIARLEVAELGTVGSQTSLYEPGVEFSFYEAEQIDSIVFDHGIVATDIEFVESGKDFKFSVNSYNLEDIRVGFTIHVEFYETPDTIIIHLREIVIPAGGSAEYSILETLRARESFNENEMTIKGFKMEPWYEVIPEE